ncbi:hypothetical protein [Ramlibacter sp.]
MLDNQVVTFAKLFVEAATQQQEDADARQKRGDPAAADIVLTDTQCKR